MATIGNQKPRNNFKVNMLEEIEFAKKLCKKYNITLSEYTELQKVAEMERRNNILVQNGYIFDEQMAGLYRPLALIAESIAEEYSDINEKYKPYIKT